MIKVRRWPKPKVLQKNERKWTEELCREREQYYQELWEFEQGQRETSPKYPKARKSRYAHDEIKAQLQNMFGPKCAYCESRVTAVAPQNVEHFRPQSIYPLLAYRWSNLLFACPICNSSFKLAQFPLLNGSQPSEDKTHPCSRDDIDDSLLINPCVDDPAEFFIFQNERILSIENNPRAERMLAVCGLNREDLVDQRRTYLYTIEIIGKMFLLANQQGNIKERHQFGEAIKKYIQTHSPYTAMSREKLRGMGIDLSQFE